jgi:hypothetical protein
MQVTCCCVLLVSLFGTGGGRGERVPAKSSASSVVYTFSGTNSAQGGNNLRVGFRLTSPGFITTEARLYSSELDYCVNCEKSSGVPAVDFSPEAVYGSQIGFNDKRRTGSVYMFPFGAFTKPGIYYSLAPFNPGKLIVTAIGSEETRTE